MSPCLKSHEDNAIIRGKQNEASLNVSTSQSSGKVDTFVHAPLLRHRNRTSIRLLRICNDSTIDIRLTMHHTDIWEQGKGYGATYTCLSYRWGNDKATRRIFVNGKATYVRGNLYDFLATWTRKGKDANKWLWIDALCIDQSNVAERNHQVQKMGQIYETAEEVIIWLGRHAAFNQHFCRAFSTLRQQVPRGPLAVRRGTAVVHRTSGPKEVVRKYKYVHENKPTLECGEIVLEYILENEYWSRAWIIQEVFLAQKRTLALNDQTMLLEEFFKRLDRYAISIRRDNACMQIRAEMHKLRSKSLICLLAHFRDKLCSVPEDRIFSLLSICADGNQFEVDYELPRAELMCRILQNCSDGLFFCTVATVARSLDIGKYSQLTDISSEFEGYFLKNLYVQDFMWKTQRAVYMAAHDADHGDKGLSIISLFDYTMCFQLCNHKQFIYVSWNESSTSSQCTPVWTDTVNEQGDRKTIIGCTYGDGFEFLRKDLVKKDFPERNLILSRDRLVRKEGPVTLATMLAEEFEEERLFGDPAWKSKARHWLAHGKSTKWAVHMSFSVLAKLTPNPMELYHNSCHEYHQRSFVSSKFNIGTADD